MFCGCVLICGGLEVNNLGFSVYSSTLAVVADSSLLLQTAWSPSPTRLHKMVFMDLWQNSDLLNYVHWILDHCWIS